jgi:hypothetical protein
MKGLNILYDFSGEIRHKNPNNTFIGVKINPKVHEKIVGKIFPLRVDLLLGSLMKSSMLLYSLLYRNMGSRRYPIRAS